MKRDANKGFAAADLVPLSKCRVYVSADTLKREKHSVPARRGAFLKV